MEVIRALEFLKLRELPEVWVDTLWDLDFTESATLDAGLEEDIVASGLPAFRSLYKALLAQVADDEGSTAAAAAAATDDAAQTSMWVLFGENGVSVKSLVAVLGYLVLGAKGKNASVQQRRLALHAASHYLLLLAVHGSIANKAFHQVLFDTCADIWSHCWPQDSTKKRKKEALKSSQSAPSQRHKATRRDQEEADEEEDEEQEEEEVHISVQELVKIRDGVVLLMQSLLRLLHRFSLKDRVQSAIHCTQIFIKLIYFEPVLGEVRFSAKRDIDGLRSVPELAFHGLSLLCTPSHGDQKESIRRVFHRLLYVIVMMSKAGSGRPSLLLPGQIVLSARELAISFVCQAVDELKELALPFLSILIQHICFQMVEKSDYRNHGSQAVGILVGYLPCSEYAAFIKWLHDYSQNAKMVYRLFSIDVVMVLLEQPERTTAPTAEEEDATAASLSPETSSFLAHKFLIHGLLFGRRKDASPTVRSHALVCLARCLELPSFNVTHAVHSLFHSGSQTELEEASSEGFNACTSIPGSTSDRASTQSLHQTQKTYRTLPFRTIEMTAADSTASAEAKENVALLMRRIADPKTNVRKSALQAFVGLLKHGVIPLTSEHLREVSDRCRDPAVSVKKKALQCLAELVAAQPHSKLVQTAALRGMVPAAMDPESSVQEKALEQLDELILSQVKQHHPAGGHLDSAQSLAWDLLGLLCTECRDLRRYFSRAFSVWSKQNKFTPAFLKKLLSHTEAEHAAGAWLLLAQVAGSAHDHISYGQILDCWDQLISAKDFNVTTCCHILSVLGDIAGSLNEDTKFRVVEDIMSWLKAFDKPLEVISASLETLFQLGRCEDVRDTQAFLNQHCGELASLSEAYLSSVILSENGTDNLNVDLMVKHLHTLGVASLHCPSRTNKKMVLLVESIVSTRNNSQPGFEDSALNFNPKCLPTKVRAHGVITLGKFCLQNEELTRRHLPAFSMELEKGEDVCVRNNVLVVLGDLCVRYTNMVDRYVPNISASIRDPEPIVREHSLTMLTSLLQEEYIKWKGSLFFRFMVALVDPVPTISSLCEYCLLHRLLKKCPVMFSQHFIECVFHFNSYSKHKTYNKFYQTEREEALFSLKGPRNRNKRFQIYRFLLQHSDNVQRFNIYSKINDSVLVPFAEEELALDADGADLLSETFAVLSLEEMRLHSMFSSVDPAAAARGEEGGDEDAANMAATQAVVQAAQNKLLSRLQKKAFMENIMPVIIELKNLMEQKRSPVLRDLMSYLQVNMKELRDEMKQFFSTDQQLMSELEYNLRMSEKENQAPPPGCGLTPSPASPNVLATLPVFATPQPLRPRQTQQNRRFSLPALLDGAKRKEALHESTRRSDVSVMSNAAALRAISTPAAGCSDVTFGEGFSAILSDINSSSADTEGSPSLNLRQDQQAQEPRLWNVQSPLRQTKQRRRKH